MMKEIHHLMVQKTIFKYNKEVPSETNTFS